MRPSNAACRTENGSHLLDGRTIGQAGGTSRTIPGCPMFPMRLLMRNSGARCTDPKKETRRHILNRHRKQPFRSCNPLNHGYGTPIQSIRCMQKRGSDPTLGPSTASKILHPPLGASVSASTALWRNLEDVYYSEYVDLRFKQR